MASESPSAVRLSPWSYLSPYKVRVGFGLLMLTATNVLFLAEPVLLGRVIDALGGPDPGERVPSLVLWMVVFAIATAVARIASRIALFNTARMAEYDLRSQLFGHLLRFEPAFYRERSTGDVMSRLTSDVQTVRALWGPGLLNVVNTAVAFGTVLFMMLRIDPMLTLWAILPYPSMVLIGRVFGRRIYRTSRAVQVQLGALSTSIQEDLSGINIIKSYALEAPRKDKFRNKSEELLKRNMALTNVRGQLVPVLSALASIGTVIVLYAGGRAVINGEISLGKLIEFNSYLARLVWPTLALGWMLSLFQRGYASWSRLTELLSAQPAIRDPDPDDVQEASGPVVGALELRGLTIEIDGRRLLDDVHLSIPAGSVTAIVGRTGSGKSTLVEALPRLLDVPAGTVFLDGRDITRIPLGELRDTIGYAPQEAFLFSTTIAGNIAFGYERGEDEATAEPRGATAAAVDAAPPSALVDAARAAGLSRDLSALPAGYDTIVGERGITLSGGQRQRVALARALATQPRVLILDDSLSSVDAETERDILEQLTEVMKDRTAILISHRVAAVKRADQIVCLDEGKVVEVGTHDELLAAGGVYAEVYQSQLEPDIPSDLERGEAGDERGEDSGEAGEAGGDGGDGGDGDADDQEGRA